MKVTFSGRLTQNPTVIEVAGDKSISHRAVMLGSLAEGVTTVRKCLLAADVVSTIGMMRAMGVSIEIANGLVTIYGAGESCNSPWPNGSGNSTFPFWDRSDEDRRNTQAAQHHLRFACGQRPSEICGVVGWPLCRWSHHGN